MNERVVRIFREFEKANQKINVLDLMLGVTNDGHVILGAMLPSGKITSSGGFEENCPWTVSAKSAIQLICDLNRELGQPTNDEN